MELMKMKKNVSIIQGTPVMAFVLCITYFFNYGKKVLPHKRGTLNKNLAVKGLKEQAFFSNATPEVSLLPLPLLFLN